jgi:hypothetical protein
LLQYLSWCPKMKQIHLRPWAETQKQVQQTKKSSKLFWWSTYYVSVHPSSLF